MADENALNTNPVVQPGTSTDEDAPKKIGKFILNWQNSIQIAIDGSTDVENADSAEWAPLAAGINNVTPAENDTTSNDEYYDGEGFGTSDVTSKRYQFTIAGHRVYGDAAQDFIVSKMLAIGDDLKTLFKFTFPDGSSVLGVVTLTTIVPTGGQPGAKQTFSFVAVFNGKPKFIPAPKTTTTN